MTRPADANVAGSPDDRIRPAATVMLIRDTFPGIEVFVLRRVAAMAFAPGMTVFPGGGVDPTDRDGPLAWLGPGEGWWADHLHVEPVAARELLVAAVRELFEETGVLLAGKSLHGPIGSLDDPVRLEMIDHRNSLSAALAAAELQLRADLLRPWANWITPPGRTRRYDTFFFVAGLPAGQQAEMLTSEADLGQWRSPRALFAERDAGTTALMPPTVAMLNDLAEYDSVADVMTAERTVIAVRVRAGDFPGVG